MSRNRSKTAIIVGASGQDGKLLSGFLRSRGYTVLGVGRRGPVNILRKGSVRRLVSKTDPQELYYLAAFHHSSQDPESADYPEVFKRSSEVHLQGLVHFLDAIRRHAPGCRTFYAGSSHVFSPCPGRRLNESTPFRPTNIYGVTKAAGLLACRYYREQEGLFVSGGILFNHESILRSPRFVSKKIVRAAVDIAQGSKEILSLGSLASRVDWGYAPDYVAAMHSILQHKEPRDFVVATGKAHSVQDFVEAAFGRVGLDWRDWVCTSPSLLKRPQLPLVGDARQLRRLTGWRPSVTFGGMVRLLVTQEIARRAGTAGQALL